MISKKNYEAPEMEIAKVESSYDVLDINVGSPVFSEDESKSRENNGEIEENNLW